MNGLPKNLTRLRFVQNVSHLTGIHQKRMLSMAKSFYKIVRSQETLDLLKYPYEFTLFALIAYRARRKNGSNINNLEVGEALMGDYENHGATEQRYRTAKNNLERWGFITNKATNKGTIIKIINTDIFNINEDHTNEQTNEPSTSHQRTT